MRPIAVSERILRANCWRLRTVSETMSKSVASDPPTCRWIVTAVIAKPKFSEPMRSAMSPSASSRGRPRPASVSTRLSSSLAGGCASSSTAWSPCLNEWPAFKVAAIVVSMSGSCSSNALTRRRTRRATNPYGSMPPMPNATSATRAGTPAAPKSTAVPTAHPIISHTNSAGRSGTAPRTSILSIERHFACRPNVPSVARNSAFNMERRSAWFPRCTVWTTCGARRCCTQLRRRIRVTE